MPDVNTPVAEPSTAPVEVPQDPAAYAEWRKTGKVAEAPPKADPAPAQEIEAGGNKPPVEKQEQNPQPRKNNAETRLQEILRDLKDAGLSPAELKTFRREAAKVAETPHQAPEQTVKPSTAPVKPKLADFEAYDAYEEAHDKYLEDLTDFKAQKALGEYRESLRQETQQKEFKVRLEAAEERYGDGATTAIIETAGAIMQDAKIPEAVKAVLDDSPVMIDLLYVIGGKPEGLAEFIALSKSNPSAAIRKAVVMEGLVQAELAKATKAADRDSSGQFVAKEKIVPEKKHAEAPPPPTELSGRGSNPPDEVARATATGDFRSFREAQNRRDLARTRGL